MAKASIETKEKIRQASSGLKKLTKEQETAIKALYDAKDEKFEHVKKLVHKSVLYKITKDKVFAPKTGRNERAEQLNEILFS